MNAMSTFMRYHALHRADPKPLYASLIIFLLVKSVKGYKRFLLERY